MSMMIKYIHFYVDQMYFHFTFYIDEWEMHNVDFLLQLQVKMTWD
jgi:hypothetical protein